MVHATVLAPRAAARSRPHLQHVRPQLISELVLVGELERRHVREEIKLGAGLLQDGHDPLRLDVGQLVQGGGCRHRRSHRSHG